MDLMKITQVTEMFGVSSRTLRYYEQVGLLRSGKTLFYMGGDATVPDSISVDDLLPRGHKAQEEHCRGWLFIGEKHAGGFAG